MFNFKDLFVLDMANNHQGDVNHGLNIIREASEIVKKNNVRGAIKFQFRQLDSFIHKDFRKNPKEKHLIRFQSTEMSHKDYQKLYDEVSKNKLYSICTPFDEKSVDLIEKMKFDIIKVASCSAKDWPLLEKISQTDLPIIISTGGLDINNIDHLVSFLNIETANLH